METATLKRKIQANIQDADQELLVKINALIEDFEYRREQDMLMEESEEDIKMGRVHTLDQVRVRYEARRSK